MLAAFSATLPKLALLHRTLRLAALSLLTLGLLLTRSSETAQAQNGLGPLPNRPHVLTQRYNNARTGAYTSETVLRPSELAAGRFGKLFTRSLDGNVIGQPLYLSGVSVRVPGTSRFETINLVIVATSRNTLYAFNADSNTGAYSNPIWQVTYTFNFLGITPVSTDEIFTGYRPFGPFSTQIGITGTPAIDPATGVIYFVTATNQFGNVTQELHALNALSGQELPNSPVTIAAAVPGIGDGAITNPISGLDEIGFDSLTNNQQAGLLVNRVSGFDDPILYIAWGSHEDSPFYHGWVLAYNATTLEQIAAFSPSPNAISDPTSGRGAGAGITMSGTGIAADPLGNVYVATGNGPVTANDFGTEYGQSVIQLDPFLNVLSFFAPFNAEDLTSAGIEMTTGGVVILPNDAASIPFTGGLNLALAGGREGLIFLLNRNNLGGYNPDFGLTPGFNNVVQQIRDSFGGQYGVPAYHNGRLYFNGAGETVRSYQLLDGRIQNTTGVGQGSVVSDFPGAAVVVSANGNNDAIVWTLGPGSGAFAENAVLRAYNASALNAAVAANPPATPIYDSTARGTADNAGRYLFYTVPTVAGGKVFVPAQNQLNVYGPRGTAAAVSPAYYVIAGPVISPVGNAPFSVFPSVNQAMDFSVVAVGPDQQPIVLNKTVQIGYRVGGSTRAIATLRFNNTSQTTFRRSFQDSGQLVIVDDRGATSLPPYQGRGPLVNVFLPTTAFLDRYSVSVKSTAFDGETVLVTIRPQSRYGTPVRLFDTVFLSDTNPQGVTLDTAYNTLNQAVFFQNQSSVTVPLTLTGVGRHVIVASNNGVGTAVVNVVPRR